MRKIIGIDLAGLEINPSGFAVLCGHKFYEKILYTDEQLIEKCMIERPDVVAIDAPLSFPKRGNLRRAELSLIKRGLRVFPPIFGGMKNLTERGMHLAKKLRASKIKVIEIHPRTSGLLIFKTHDRAGWISRLRRRGFNFAGGKSIHELDAVMAAVTGQFYLEGRTEKVGEEKEGIIIIPSE
jgi:predicted nuclease with RNAse H fold